VDLDANSHGQSFLQLFRSRFVPGGLYLLDEPEAPLSPQSQLGLIAMISDMVAQDAQFIVATHSPLLLAYPGATIVSFDHAPMAPVRYEELESVRLVRDFLAEPERYLRRLVGGSDAGPDARSAR
jgi:predicted ATPase